MNPSLEETIIVDFITSSPTTGAAVDADSLPTCAVYEETNDTALVTPTVVKRTSLTGNYRVPVVCTAVNGFEAGKSYAVIISATVGAVAAKAVAKNFQMRARDTDDLATQTSLDTVDDFIDLEIAATLAAVDTEVAAIKAKTDSLTFTVAGQVDSNVQSINDVTITGDGQVGTEFGV